jgi:hypothetical protein
MKNKIFGIGLNKTGTTSLGKYFSLLGYKHYCKRNAGDSEYVSGGKLIEIIQKNNINKIYRLADNFEIFEDWPWPLIYKELYYKYPSSKFILTIRKNEDEWFDSLLRHSYKTGPTNQRLLVYGHYNPNENNKIDHTIIYKNHNNDVIKFFNENDQNRLLILNTDDLNKEEKIYNFIDKYYDKNNYIKYPHANKDRSKYLKNKKTK